MQEEVFLRRSFTEYNPETVAYIEYELTNAKPDFSTFTDGSSHSVVLRNKATKKLERINFTICGDDGDYPDHFRRVWGDIESDDYHMILVFELIGDSPIKVTASFCGNSMSREKYSKIVNESPYAAAATANDLFHRSFPNLR